MPACRRDGADLVLQVRVQPRASRSEIAGLHGEQVARTRMVSLAVLFEGMLPKGMASRPTTLRP